VSGHSISALVVDDEPLARQRIVRLLARDPEFTVVAACASVGEAIELDPAAQVDLVLLDIRMPERDGFSLLEVMRERGIDPFVIFVTAYSEHAAAAFEIEAVDYVVKPFDDHRFAKAITRAKTIIQQVRASFDRVPAATPGALPSAAMRGLRFPGRLLICEKGRVLFLPIHIIEFVQAAGKCVKVFAQGNCHVLREPLQEIEARLDASQFVRIHRSTIVNVEQIVELQPLFHGDYEVVLKRGTRLTMSRRFRSRMSPFFAGAWPA
jgi:two-component system, LytTR family, response regulator